MKSKQKSGEPGKNSGDSIVKYHFALEETVSRVSRHLVVGDEPDLSRILQQIAETISADLAFICHYHRNTEQMELKHEWRATGTDPVNNDPAINDPAANSWWHSQIKDGQAILISDTDKLPAGMQTGRHFFLENRIKALAAFPLATGNGTIGFIGFGCSDKERIWQEYETKTLRVLSEIIASDFERRQTRQALEIMTGQQQLLLETARHLTGSLDVKEVLTRIGHQAKEMLAARDCIIFNLEPDKISLIPVVVVGIPEQDKVFAQTININNSMTGESVREKRGMIFNFAAESKSAFHVPGTPKDEGEHVIVAPFIVDDQVLGAMCISRLDRIFSVDNLVLTESFATYAATALKNARLHHDLLLEVEERKQAQQKEQELASDLAFLSRTALNFVEISGGADIYDFIGRKLLHLIAGSFTVIYSFDSSARRFRIESIHGLDDRSAQLEKLVGRNPVGIRGKIVPDIIPTLLHGELIPSPDIVTVLYGTKLNDRSLKNLVATIGCHESYSIGFTYDGQLLAAATIGVTAADQIKNPTLVNAFVRQAAVALQRQRAERELLESEQRYRTIFQTTAVAIIEQDQRQLETHIQELKNAGISDIQRYLDENPVKRNEFIERIKVIDANDFAIKMLEATDKQELLAKFPEIFKPVILKIIEQLYLLPVIDQVRYTDEAGLVTLKNNKIHVLVKYSRPNQDAQREHLLVSITDITELKKTQHQLQEYATELERSNQELEQFAYAASHDLQEPLRMVTSYVQLLAREYSGRLDDEADLMIHFAVDGAKRMQGLIHGLLLYSRVGTQGKTFAVCNSGIVLDNTMKNLQLVIEESGARISSKKLPEIIADDVQLGQVFQNLIGNAIKFRGNEPPLIHISATKETAHWVFSVRDNGIGFAPEHSDRIFEIFQRLHPRDKYPGTGIGLSICKRIVERHGGEFRVESAPGEGSTFSFSISEGLNE
ncbi:MAG: ATP-binding protein [Candidatus Neomarinimicrobiota bacterium]